MQNFRGKKTKDIETASETVLFNNGVTNSIQSKTSPTLSLGISEQQLDEGDFDGQLEKRN